jgi:hypothetical protein
MLPPTDLPFEINLETYGQDFQTPPKEITTKQVDGYIVWAIERYKTQKEIDIALWEALQEDFEGWTTEFWEKGSRAGLKYLRIFLITHGVFVREPKGKSYAQRLVECISNESFYK